MSSVETTHRFLRPSDATRVRRNQKRIDVQRMLSLARTLVLIAAAGIALFWLYRQTQSSHRFDVRTVEVLGAVHTSPEEIDSIVKRYTGVNLFQIDIARVQHDLSGLTWVRRIEIEKKLPDTLRVRIVERVPVALSRQGKTFRYVDEDGLDFAPITATFSSDLPVVNDATAVELRRTVTFLGALRQHDPAVYSRISEIRPVAPRGFQIFDRDLAAPVFVNGDDVSAKFRDFYGIVRAENLRRGTIEYADLRFSDRIVIKPLASDHPLPFAGEGGRRPESPDQYPITN